MFWEDKFDLRGWEYSDPSLEDHNSAVVLGLIWDRKVDRLAVNSLKTVKLEVCVCWLTDEETIILEYKRVTCVFCGIFVLWKIQEA